jgi:hypothetical protein
MANTDARSWSRSEILSQSASHGPIEAGYSPFSDDGFDFPPTAHPIRELITFSLFVTSIIALLVWGGSKLL